LIDPSISSIFWHNMCARRFEYQITDNIRKAQARMTPDEAAARFPSMRRALAAFLLYTQTRNSAASQTITADPDLAPDRIDPVLLAPTARYISSSGARTHINVVRASAVLDAAMPGWRDHAVARSAIDSKCFIVGSGLSGAPDSMETNMRTAAAHAWLSRTPSEEFTLAWLSVSPRAALRAVVDDIVAGIEHPAEHSIGDPAEHSIGDPAEHPAELSIGDPADRGLRIEAATRAVVRSATSPGARAVIWRALERMLRKSEMGSVECKLMPAVLAKLAADADAGIPGPTRVDLLRVALGSRSVWQSRWHSKCLGINLRQIIAVDKQIINNFIRQGLSLADSFKQIDYQSCGVLIAYSSDDAEYDIPEIRRELDMGGFVFQFAWSSVLHPRQGSRLQLNWLERIVAAHPDLAAVALMSAASSGRVMPPSPEFAELAALAPATPCEWDALGASLGLASGDLARALRRVDKFPFADGGLAGCTGVVGVGIANAIAAGLLAARENGPRCVLPPVIV
jgi:hypothetical protein